MGQVSTEQTTAIIEAVGDALGKAQAETTTVIAETNYWWLAVIAILPIIAGSFITWIKRKKKL